MHPFGAALEAGDIDSAIAMLREDVVFRSPVAFKPHHGRPATGVILHAVSRVFADFRYVRAIGAADAVDHALVFRARVGEFDIEGCDFLHLDEDGAIDELTVMVRPLSAAHALAEAMNIQLAAAGGSGTT